MTGTVRNSALQSACAVILVLIAGASAQAETLADAVALAYATNPNLQAQRAALKATDESYVQARAGYGPQVQVSASDAYEKDRGTFLSQVPGAVGQQAASSTSASISVSQSIYSGGRLHAAVDSAQAAILAQRETVRQTEIQVLQAVASAYAAVRRDMATLAVYRDTVLALQRQLDQTQAEYAVRQVTQTDVNEAQGRLALAKSGAASAQAGLDISRSQYLQIVGENPADLAPEPPLQVFPNLDSAFDAAENNNPAISIALYQEQAARVRVSQARANYLPNVTAQAQIAKSAVEPYSSALGQQTIYYAGVSVTQPIYTSGLYASQVRQALAEVNQARFSVEASRRTAVQSVAQAWSQLIAARTALVADEQGVKATEAAFYGVRREQPFDLRQPIDVLNAEQELNNAQIRLLQDRYSEYTAQVNLLAAAGVLNAAVLSPEVKVANPVASFNKTKFRGDFPWTDLLQAVDSIGAPSVAPPKPTIREGERLQGLTAALPPAPTEAQRTAPLQSATSIMEAEARDNPNAEGGDVVGAKKCVYSGGRLIGDCPAAQPTPAVPAPDHP